MSFIVETITGEIQLKITFNRSSLLKSLIAVSAAVPSRTPKDILKNVLMVGKGNRIELVATDQEIGIRVELPEDAIVSQSVQDSFNNFEILFPPQRVRSILQELSSVDVVFDIDDEDRNMRIIASGAKFRITTEDANEYPPVPKMSGEGCFQVPLPVFELAVRRTDFACDTESTRYALGGINIEHDGNKCVLAATDSRRLSVVEMAAEVIGSPKKITKPTVVPVKACKIIAGIGGAENIQVQVNENDVMFCIGNVTVYSRLIEGRFPRYRDVIPKRGNVRVNLPSGPFASVLRQSQICLDNETRAVTLTFDQGVVTLESTSSAGQSAVEFPCEYDSEKMVLSVDPKYIADFLKTMSAEQMVEVSIIDANTAITFRVGDSVTYVVMPLAIDR